MECRDPFGQGYRARAKQLRDEAEAINIVASRDALLKIAANYEQLASRVEKSSRTNSD